MQETYEKLIETTESPSNVKYYLGYQYRYGRDYIVPYLKSKGIFSNGVNVAEIGSAEGGVLAALKMAGADKALATDISSIRLDMGNKIAKQAGIDIEFKLHDILMDEIPDEWYSFFDIVILRDVIEHLTDAKTALIRIKKILKPGAYLYLTFPPYNSPFGGHQHTIATALGKIPYIHLLPKKLFFAMLAGGRAADIDEVKRLNNIKLSPDKLIKAALSCEYSIFKEDYFLLRPVFKNKFGIPALKLGLLSKSDFARNYLSLEASFILKNK